MKNSLTLGTVYLVAFAGFTSLSWLYPVIPYYTAGMGISVSDTGFIVSIYSYVMAAGIIPFGVLSDRIGRRQFLVSGLLISAIVPFLYPYARDMLSLSLLRALHGLGAALFIPLALAIVTDLSQRGEHGKAMGWYTFSSQLGMMAGPVAGGYVVQHFGFQAAFLVCGIIPLLALLLLMTRIRSIPQRPQPLETHSIHPWRWLGHPGAIVSLLALVVTALASASVSTYIPLYVHGFAIPESGAGMIITACYASSAALRIPSGGMADRFGNGPMVVSGIFISAVAIALVTAFQSLWLLAAVGALYGIGMGLSMPASLSWLAHLSPTDKRGFSMGLGSAAFQVGLALGSTLQGLVVQNSGFTFMYLCTASAALSASIIMAVLLYRPGAAAPRGS